MEIAAMSPPVSPQWRRDRGSGPTDRGGFHPQPQNNFSTIPQSRKISNFAYFRTPPALRATSPIRAPCAAEEDITTHLPHTNFTARLPTSQFSQPLTLNSKPQAATGNVSPCIAAPARYRGSGSSEPKGLTVSREAAFLQGCQSCNVDSFKPLRRSAPPPLSALRARQRRTLLRICPHSHRKHTHIRKHTEEDIVTFPLSTAHNRIFANFTVPSTLNSQLSTLNPRLSTLNPQLSTLNSQP